MLTDLAQSRDNNFNLIRIIAAFAVLVTHSFVLTIGTEDAEPSIFGMTMGTIAVDVFFITSGYLVTSSLLNRQSTIEFVWARVLRIYPALWVMLFITVFVVGMFFTSLPKSSYLSSPETYFYLVKCSTLIMGVVYELPGVFNDNPFKDSVNGSLWTMRHEVRLYLLLALVWFTLRIVPKSRLRVFRMITVSFFFMGGLYILVSHFHFNTTRLFPRLFFMFFTGATFYVLREHIALSRGLFWLLVISLSLATVNEHLFFIVYLAVIAYILFYAAYVPSGLIRKYNHFGDYSYGIYIYAFPVQQSVVALMPGVSVSQMLLISIVPTILLAVLSWHLLERRALSLKDHYIGITRRITLLKNWTGKSDA
jgi:peptidoglycan/LPS O-acetylase OafA/YrhL